VAAAAGDLQDAFVYAEVIHHLLVAVDTLGPEIFMVLVAKENKVLSSLICSQERPFFTCRDLADLWGCGRVTSFGKRWHIKR